MSRRRSTIAALGLAAAGLLVAAGCGGGDDGSAGTTAGSGEARTTASSGAEASTTAPSGGAAATDTAAGGAAPAGNGAAAELPPCPLAALDEASGPVEVVVWHSQVAKPADTLSALVDQYNASQDKVRVRLESQGASYGELKRKFQAALPSGDLPALIMFDDTSTKEMADSGVVLPGQACFDAAGIDLSAFGTTATSYYTINSVLWPVAANPAGILLYYNRDHFIAAGLDPDQPPQTLAEVRTAAEAIKTAGVSDTPLVHELSSWKTEFWLTGAHSSIVNNDNGRGSGITDAATLADNPEALELFTWFDDMRRAGLMEPVASTDGQVDHFLAMATQRASMLVESSSAATSVEAFLAGALDTGVLGPDAPKPEGLDIEAGPFPGLRPGSRTQMGGAAWYLMNTSAPEVQAAAFDFATFINSPAAQAQLLTGGSFLPWRSDVLDAAEVQDYFSTSLAGKWLELAGRQLDQIDPTFPGPLIGPYDPDVREAIEQAQDQLLFANATPQQALDQAQTAIDQLLADYNSFS